LKAFWNSRLQVKAQSAFHIFTCQKISLAECKAARRIHAEKKGLMKKLGAE